MSQVRMENRAKIDQKAHGKYDEKKKASWRHLGGVLEASWAPKNPLDALNPLHALAVAGSQRPLLRIPWGFFWIFLGIS